MTYSHPAKPARVRRTTESISVNNRRQVPVGKRLRTESGGGDKSGSIIQRVKRPLVANGDHAEAAGRARKPVQEKAEAVIRAVDGWKLHKEKRSESEERSVRPRQGTQSESSAQGQSVIL